MGYCGCYICDTDIDNWPSGTTAAEKEALIKKWEEIVNAITHTHYCAKPFDIRINGNDKNRIFLPLKANILTISKVEIFGEELESAYYAFDHNSIYINPESGSLGIELSYLLSEAGGDCLFPRGYNNIRVRGTYGASPVPAWIKDVLKILIRHENDPSLYTTYLMGSESIGAYSYTLADVTKYGYMTGVKEADDILRLFKRGKCIIMTP